jgi:hypothetical protein
MRVQNQKHETGEEKVLLHIIIINGPSYLENRATETKKQESD